MGFNKLNNRYFNINFSNSKERNYLGNMNGGDIVKKLFKCLKCKDLNETYNILNNLDKQTLVNTINTKDKDGNTLLHLVVNNYETTQNEAYIELAKKLYTLGAKYNIPNNKGERVVPTEELQNFIAQENKEIINENIPKQIIVTKSKPVESSISEITIEDMTAKAQTIPIAKLPEPESTINSITVEDITEQKPQIGGYYSENSSISNLTIENISLNKQTGGNYSSESASNSSSARTGKVVVGRRTIVEDIDLSQVGGLAAKKTKKAKETKDEKKDKKESTKSDGENADDIHKEVLEKIKDLMKLKGKEGDIDARVYKAILYKHIKETMPELNNLDRAKQMLKHTTKKMFDELEDKIKSVGPEIKKHLQEKEARRSESSLNMSTMSESTV
jgi:hypothetical protein